ncbi:hemin-degrading factor [Pseudooceanicola sp. CBS1P-1]|uniref:Hemin-degrading factor n=1 Tax=Pseudooceanicola albus TaxID=2692189 RepID=A0A6L7G1V6_9RHOB|nr:MULTISPECIES: ChuX/HutX family heme-like substrate-binding protein [Pseudooceanicola]MBT9383551.1 hemin-degrading factor [Pseudooceanicola endophyticus]MXN17406.1 hemin-degrading factor [Pseudooceanicola albus]
MRACPPAETLRAARRDSTLRARDLAASLNVSEAALVAAHTGAPAPFSVTRIAADPDVLMPNMARLGRIMSLTRNDSCVLERVGTFGDYHSGAHAAFVLGKEIDTRLFPKYWTYGFAVEEETAKGLRRSLQVFDRYGEALQKIYLREESNTEAWAPLIAELRLDDQSPEIDPHAPPAPEGARPAPGKREALVAEWRKMTDTHQFNRICTRLGMNRLGAYRMAGAPFARRVAVSAVADWLEAVSAAHQRVGFFVGNRGHIQIHWGTFDTLKPMGPWLNVLDPEVNIHLRNDHIAEVYVVEKPTKRGPATSIEAFDARGELIFQCFGQRTETDETLDGWHAILDAIPSLREAAE